MGLVVFGLSNVGRVGCGMVGMTAETFRGFVHGTVPVRSRCSPSITADQTSSDSFGLVLWYYSMVDINIFAYICTTSNLQSLPMVFEISTEAAILGLPVVLLLSLLGFEDRWWSSYLAKIGEGS